MDLDEEESKEEEATLPAAIEVRVETSDESSPSNVVARVLSELAPKEEVTESASRVSLSRLKISCLRQQQRGTPGRHTS